MKRIVFALLLVAFSFPALADKKSDLDVLVRKLTAKFEALQANHDKRIPADKLKKAKGIILLDRTKAGFIFAYQGGSGVAMLKHGDSWGEPLFMQGNEASLGFQVGAQQSFYVTLLMDTNAVASLVEGRFAFGGEARGTAGDKTSGAEGVMVSDESPVLIYSDVAGLYGGAALKGGAVTVNTDANLAYYDDFTSARELLTATKGQPETPAVKKLKEALSQAAKNGKL